MTQLFTNNAASGLASAVGAGATAIPLKTGDGAKFPTPGGGDFFLVTLFQKSGADEVNHEIVKCTARSGDTLTVVRAQEGTAARAFNVDDPLELRLTAGTLAGLAPLTGTGATGNWGISITGNAATAPWAGISGKPAVIAAGATAADARTAIGAGTSNLALGTTSGTALAGDTEYGYKNIPQNSQSAAYTLGLDDAGKHIFHPSADTTARTFTIPANSSVAYPIGTTITFINQSGAGVLTIAITADTMRLAGAGTTGSHTLAANGVATAIKIAATEWIISGFMEKAWTWTWTAGESSRSWYGVASSSDGTKLVATANGDQIYTSTDSGVSWTARDSVRDWYGVASSSDGTNLVAVAWGDQIYTSTDSGISWTARDSVRDWYSVASSSDGTNLVAAENGGQIYTSTDSGISWTARESARYWSAVASSSDGTKLAAAANGDQIYTSTDSGVSWTARESSRSWYGVASSSDGTKLVAVESGGQIYTSTDSGISWTARESARYWYGVASSSDGTNLVAVAWGDQIYTSTDSGISWTASDTARSWTSVASSADGAKLVAVASGDQIYTGVYE